MLVVCMQLADRLIRPTVWSGMQKLLLLAAPNSMVEPCCLIGLVNGFGAPQVAGCELNILCW